MPEPNEDSGSCDPVFQPVLEAWGRYVRQANEAARQGLAEAGVDIDPAAIRREWFDALSRQADAFLRSPAFLGTLKSQLDAVMSALRDRRQADRDPHAERMSEFEREMNARIEQIESSLDEIEQKIGAGGQSRENASRSRASTRQEQPVETRGTTPHTVVSREGTARLLRYKCNAVRFAEPVLICYALINRPYILDLQAERSVVRKLCEAGFDVYLIDWGVPTDADRELRLEDYICGLMKNAVNCVQRTADSEQINLLGYCMGGTMATMFTALFPGVVRNLTLMATPIDFAGEEGLLNLWTRPEYFDVDTLIDTFGNCPGEFLQYCFQLMKPVQNFGEKYAQLCENLDDDAFLRNFLAMEQWTNDSIPVAGETFREFVKMLYQQNRLVRGDMRLGEEAVRLETIRCPLLLLVSEQDHLVPPGSTLALERSVQSTDVKAVTINSGHVGLAVSSKSHRELWPQAVQWLAEHSTSAAH
ncbi:MAG: class III poly(R)-hydroxyalkanoic acid synthase subunit PhaC [Planctomycetota bacterium]|nr:MAG: class III poly(R)-hydroxyalkanoic acid synthase subunit PhaC [Planctomycetota bacterium]REK22450.1 MAG: class III poly(R)-hydroxyalkanoic acid synthase subunit PhaC [Planctomycetota bacterium]REK34900.1 MAG: class III poly(R)-hydroxyalkanoic acid synthase subunit PhaC [Planctomycetota bacterium]